MTEKRVCHVCGSKDVKWVQTTSPLSSPWIFVNVFYCEGCARIVGNFEAKLSEILCGRLE